MFVAWPTPPPAVSFLVRSTEERVTEVLGPFTQNAEPGPLELEAPPDTEWRSIGFESADLDVVFPRRPLPVREDALQLIPEPESCLHGRFSKADGRPERTVAASMAGPVVHRLDLDLGRFVPEPEPSFATRLSLRAPEDPERCLEEVPLRHYRPFGAREALLEGVTELAGLPVPTRPALVEPLWDLDFRGAVWLGEDRALTHSLSALFVVERGGELVDSPLAYRRLAAEFDGDPAGVMYAIEQVVLDPRTRSSPERRLIVLVSGALRTGPSRPGRILELVVDAAGLGALRELWRSTDQVRRAVIEPSGRALVVGERGLVVVLDPDPEVPPVELRLSSGLPWLTHILLTGDPARPHLVGTEQGAFFLGDVMSGRMEQISDASSILVGLPAGVEVSHRSGELEILAWPQQPGLRRWRAATGWQAAELSLGGSLAECSSLENECGEQQPSGLSHAILSAPEGYDLTATMECDAIFLLDFEARCGRGLFPEGQTQARRRPPDHFRGLARDGDRYLAVGSNGRLVEFQAR